MSQPNALSLDAGGNILIANRDGTEILKLAAGRGVVETSDITAQIRVPYENSMVYAYVPIIGTAAAKNFDRYTVEYGFGKEPAEWTTLITSHTMVIDDYRSLPELVTIYGNLATWPVTPGNCDLTGGLSQGTYTIRLTVYDQAGRYKQDSVQVEVGRLIGFWHGWTLLSYLSSDDNLVTLNVPSGATTDDIDLFSIKPVNPGDAPPVNDPELTLAGQVYQILPAGYKFLKPCTLKMSYADAQLGGIDEKTLKIYRWNPLIRRWIYVYADLDTASNVLTTTLTEFNEYEVYYAIMSDPPPAPVIYEPTATGLMTTLIFGKASPGVSVEVFVNSVSQGLVKADENTGEFGKTVQLQPGDNTITAVAVDPAGNRSETSSSHVHVDPLQPASVSSLAFKTGDFAADLPGEATVTLGDVLYIELTGQHAETQTIGSALVRLTSHQDAAGISVQLLETAVNSGIYRGTARVGEMSKPGEGTIGVSPTGPDTTTVTADIDPTRQDVIGTADRVPPPAPSITSPTHPSLCQDTFEADLGEWAGMSAGYGARVSKSGEAASSGLYSVKLVSTNSQGDSAGYVRMSPFDARQYPIVAFDYKIPEGLKVNLIAYVNGMWKEVVFTDDPKTVETFGEDLYRTVGRIEGVTADNNWHHAEFNLYNMLRNDDPDQTELIVEELFFADYDLPGWMELIMGGENAKDTTYHIDNFIISEGGKSNNSPVFAWAANDAGVVGCSYVLDQDPGTLPDEVSEGSAPSVTHSNVPDGIWYFHVRSLDGGGNWGPANHYRLMIDTTGPVAHSPEPQDESLSGSLEVKLGITDGDGSGVDPDTIKLRIISDLGARVSDYDMKSGGLSYDEKTGILTFSLWKVVPAAEPWQDGEIIQASLIAASDFAGNPIEAPFSWSWTVDYTTLAGGYLSLLTTQGGFTPTWSPDAGKIAFMSERSGNEDVWIIDSDDYAEAKGTARQLTFDPAHDHHPAWSPTDNRIAFISDRDGFHHIYIMNADGSGLAQISHGEYDDAHPTWSPDGSRIAFSRDGEIWTINSDGTNETQITFDSVEYYLEPSWSPDGLKIVFTKSLYVDEVAVMNADGTNENVLTSSGRDVLPTWSKQTNQIVFVTWRDETTEALRIVNSDGSGESAYIDNQGLWWDSEPEQSPVGDNVAFQSTRNGIWNIWVKTQLQIMSTSASPNPFSPNYDGIDDTVDIGFRLVGGSAEVDVKIYDAAGDTVATLLDHEFAWDGQNLLTWAGFDDYGNMVPDGTYSYKISIPGSGGARTIEESGTIVVDTAAPEFSDWSIPQLDYSTTGPQDIGVNVMDISGIKPGALRLQYGIGSSESRSLPDIIGWTDFGSGANGTLELSWPNYLGEYLYVRCFAEDAHGNRTYSNVQTRFIRPRNLAPACRLIAPLGGEVWSGIKSVKWEAYDPDGDVLSISVEYSPDEGATWLPLTSGEANDGTYYWDTEMVPDGYYLVRITAGDGEFNVSAQSRAAFDIFNNQPPVPNAGSDQTVHAGMVVTLDGSGSSDPDRHYPLTYSWRIVSAPPESAAVLSDPASVTPFFTADEYGDYEIELIVIDGLGLPSMPGIVRVSTTNTMPVADAGPDQAVITPGTTVQLDGSQSWDPDGDPIIPVWTITAKPLSSAASLSDPYSMTPTFIADLKGEYLIELMVSDPWMSSESDSVTVSFSNVKPVANAGDNQAVAVCDVVYLDGSRSHDVNVDSLTYSWSFASRPGGSSAVLSDENTIYPNFVADKAGTYVLSLVVDDGALASEPSNITVVAVATKNSVVTKLMEAISAANLLTDLKNHNLSKTLTNKINATIASVDQGLYQDALNKLENDILKKMDGCAMRGYPDENDWITTCEGQASIYFLIMDAIDLLELLT